MVLFTILVYTSSSKMLKITKKVEYALIAVRHLQENKDKLVPVAEISSSYGIPREVLAKTLQKLASSNVIESYRVLLVATKLLIKLKKQH